MEEKDTSTTRRFGYGVYALVVLIPVLVIGAAGSWLGGLFVGGLVVVLIALSEWGGAGVYVASCEPARRRGGPLR